MDLGNIDNAIANGNVYANHADSENLESFSISENVGGITGEFYGAGLTNSIVNGDVSGTFNVGDAIGYGYDG